MKFKLLNKYAREVIEFNKLTYKYRILKEWLELYEERREMRPQIEISERHYLQKVWSKMNYGV